ncbi:multifunctional acyl-CoA thioesterase I and protease I and lysophospholipase L1 [Rhodospirillaceae bacterium LM-1]|nr:multifunctional acyl-CoA thioesterase I and protease I and lysophospholipase L1 [Rhodospirillaceae bacterium LM-1]
MSRWMCRFLCHAGLILTLYQAFPASAASLRLLALGDSLTAGYGLGKDQGLAAKLEAALKSKGREVRVVNAGVSGDTTAGGLARLDWSLAEPPDAVLVALGANDMLRGLPPQESERNLDAILARLQERKLPVLLIGMKASVNLGLDYAGQFDAIYPRLAKKYGVPLYPFFLEGVALKPGLNQEDGLHPNEKGVDEIVRRLLPDVLRLLDRTKGQKR